MYDNCLCGEKINDRYLDGGTGHLSHICMDGKLKYGNIISCFGRRKVCPDKNINESFTFTR